MLDEPIHIKCSQECPCCKQQFYKYEKGLEKHFYPSWAKTEKLENYLCCSEECVEELEKELAWEWTDEE